MSEADRLDIIEAADEEGNSIFLSVERYFYYNGGEYVLLREVADENGAQPLGESRLHVMRVDISRDDEGEEVEDFVPISEELTDRLIQSASIRYERPEDGIGADE